ncbi:hypothetical protein [Aeromonas sp. MdU4]|uniref:hypothetical protein n=1 Tax=Aeromonas sp. MdU4 TaxID=3342819 RepID=UPI0035BB6608
MTDSHLSDLVEVGRQLLILLAKGDMRTADKLAEHYLNLLDDVFRLISSETELDIEHRRALQQFQTIYEWVANAKCETESELWQLSKASRVSDLYKLNAG